MTLRRRAAARTGPLRRRPGPLGLALAAALAVLAGCGITASDAGPEPTPDAIADGATTPEDDPGAGIGLGRLEAGFGPASLVIDAIAPADADDRPLGEEWIGVVHPKDPVETCNFGRPVAETERSWVRPQTSEGLGVSITAYADPAAAQAAAELASGPAYRRCLEDRLVSITAMLAETGFTTPITLEPDPDVVDPIVGDTGFTRWITQTLGQGSAQTVLRSAVTIRVAGSNVVAAEAALLESNDDHRDLTERLFELIEPGAIDGSSAPVLDAGIDRLRAGVLGPEAPSEFFRLVEPAVAARPPDDACVDRTTPMAVLHGPTWATDQNISAIVQIGAVHPDSDRAAASITAGATAEASCRADQVVDLFFGSMAFTDGSVEIVERAGRRFLVETMNLEQTLDGAPPAAALAVTVTTAVGSEVVGWQFLGLRGDEPDLLELTARVAERLERKTSAAEPAGDAPDGDGS